MIRAKLRDAAAWCGAVRCVPADLDAEAAFAGVSTDTRTLSPGQLFVPLAGERYDGHDYWRAAEEAGAAAALWQADRPLPDGTALPLLVVDDTLAALQRLAQRYLETLPARVVAVTGSNGKTTTKDLIASVLATALKVHKTQGNLNNHIGLPLTILRAEPDTQALVLEMGMSGAGEIALLSRLAKPDAAVVTNVGEAHLLHLGSRRGIARAKLEIAEGLKPGGALIYLGDEPLLREELATAALPADARLVTFGESAACDVAARDVRSGLDSASFATADDPDTVYELPVPGRHNAINALAAVCVGRLFGLSAARIREGLRSAETTGMRIERTAAWNGAVVLNDAYNASPASVRAALSLVASLDGCRRKWVVFGDMLELGPDEVRFHAEIGREAAAAADVLYAYGPLAAHAARAAAESGLAPADARHYADKAELAADVMERLSPDDLVLVKASRGMRLEDVVRALEQGPGR